MNLSVIPPNELQQAIQPGLQIVAQWISSQGLPERGTEFTRMRDLLEQRLLFALEEADAASFGPHWSWLRAASQLGVLAALMLIEEPTSRNPF